MAADAAGKKAEKAKATKASKATKATGTKKEKKKKTTKNEPTTIMVQPKAEGDLFPDARVEEEEEEGDGAKVVLEHEAYGALRVGLRVDDANDETKEPQTGNSEPKKRKGQGDDAPTDTAAAKAAGSQLHDDCLPGCKGSNGELQRKGHHVRCVHHYAAPASASASASASKPDGGGRVVVSQANLPKSFDTQAQALRFVFKDDHKMKSMPRPAIGRAPDIDMDDFASQTRQIRPAHEVLMQKALDDGRTTDGDLQNLAALTHIGEFGVRTWMMGHMPTVILRRTSVWWVETGQYLANPKAEHFDEWADALGDDDHPLTAHQLKAWVAAKRDTAPGSLASRISSQADIKRRVVKMEFLSEDEQPLAEHRCFADALPKHAHGSAMGGKSYWPRYDDRYPERNQRSLDLASICDHVSAADFRESLDRINAVAARMPKLHWHVAGLVLALPTASLSAWGLRFAYYLWMRNMEAIVRQVNMEDRYRKKNITWALCGAPGDLESSFAVISAHKNPEAARSHGAALVHQWRFERYRHARPTCVQWLRRSLARRRRQRARRDRWVDKGMVCTIPGEDDDDLPGEAGSGFKQKKEKKSLMTLPKRAAIGMFMFLFSDLLKKRRRVAGSAYKEKGKETGSGEGGGEAKTGDGAEEREGETGEAGETGKVDEAKTDEATETKGGEGEGRGGGGIEGREAGAVQTKTPPQPLEDG